MLLTPDNEKKPHLLPVYASVGTQTMVHFEKPVLIQTWFWETLDTSWLTLPTVHTTNYTPPKSTHKLYTA